MQTIGSSDGMINIIFQLLGAFEFVVIVSILFVLFFLRLQKHYRWRLLILCLFFTFFSNKESYFASWFSWRYLWS